MNNLTHLTLPLLPPRVEEKLVSALGFEPRLSGLQPEVLPLYDTLILAQKVSNL